MPESSQPDVLAHTLDFCARVTASATHEIKNELAVLNEQAHLCREMLAAAQAGREPDPERLLQLLGRIVARVDTADQAVRRLNRFAHSADLEHAQTDAAQAVETVAGLFGRLAAQRRQTLELRQPLPSVRVPARPVMLEQALWACLVALCAAAEPGGRLELSLGQSGDEVLVRFRGQLTSPPQPPRPEVLDPIGAEVREGGPGELLLAVPLTPKETRS